MNYTLLDRVRALSTASNPDERCSGEAVEHVVYLHKQTVTTALKVKKPCEILFVEVLDTFKILSLSCVSYLNEHKSIRPRKQTDHAEVGIYIYIYMDQNRLICIHLWKSNSIVKTKLTTFNKIWYPRRNVSEQRVDIYDTAWKEQVPHYEFSKEHPENQSKIEMGNEAEMNFSSEHTVPINRN